MDLVDVGPRRLHEVLQELDEVVGVAVADVVRAHPPFTCRRSDSRVRGVEHAVVVLLEAEEHQHQVGQLLLPALAFLLIEVAVSPSTRR